MGRTRAPHGLTGKQRAFIQEYLVDLNGSAAARRAGYKASTSQIYAQKASGLIALPHIQKALTEAMAAREKRTNVTADYVLSTIAETVERCRQARPVVDDKGKETGQFQFDARAVLRGAELLGRHLGMWIDRHGFVDPQGKLVEPTAMGELELARRIAFIFRQGMQARSVLRPGGPLEAPKSERLDS